MKFVLAAQQWLTNAALIADCARLGYVGGGVLDPTYGRGRWWLDHCPDDLTTSDLDPKKAELTADFRHLPFPASTFDSVAFDPPYVAMGGRRTANLPDMHDRYGMIDAPRTPADLQELINDGATECARVLRKKGHLLVKCKDYVSSGKLWIGTHHTLTHALGLGLECVDRFEYCLKAPPPAPPSNRRQVHARRNLSTLFVFRKS